VAADAEPKGKDRDKGKGNGKPAAKVEPAPDVTGLDLASVEPIFITYTVTEEDLKNVGELPAKVAEQAKLKWLPYQSAAEAIAEKFHSDVDFIALLNPDKIKSIKAGDQLKVPNVEPFDLATVKDIKPGGDVASQAANEIDAADAQEKDEVGAKEKDKPQGEAKPKNKNGKDKTNAKNKNKKSEEAAEANLPTVTVKVDTKTNMLSVLEGEKLVAAYPVTIGSAQTESPIGDWKIKGVARLPDFRYDEKLLKEGTRGDESHLLPPGPNNPVGVIWIALSKKGNGLHGTSDPDAIGRSASHGCVRLANWDVVRLAGKVKAGVGVSIH
jgi:lipoprotein-anchoring transpeptidase ErfK/SrfK